MKVHVIDEESVGRAGCFDYRAAIRDVESAYKAHAARRTLSSKIAIDIDTALDWKFNSLVCVGDKFALNKWLGANAGNLKKGLPRSSGLIILNDRATGLPLCIMNGTSISAVRTGASAAVAAKHLAKRGATTAAVIGTGPIGKECVMALAAAGFKNIKITSLDPGLDGIAKKWSSACDADVSAAASVQDSCAGSAVVVSATTASKPIIKRAWLEKGVLRINLGGREDEDDIILESDKLINDCWESAKHRNVQTISNMYHEKKIRDSDVYQDIGHILLGKVPGRESDDEMIFFNAVGLGELDLFIAQRIYEKAGKDKSFEL
ncbi:ornithine cyclodeaminase family protein [Candidatus Woesearchaeota archaeon]|nr:ornithine cyclodeaminase family protein [Candidatus Woesearchaeota archaeon]